LDLIHGNAPNLRRERVEIGDHPPGGGLEIALDDHERLLRRCLDVGQHKSTANDRQPSDDETEGVARCGRDAGKDIVFQYPQPQGDDT
jgi:hypothetical protein